jgi:deoxyribose-phosphate aldolase
VDADRRLLIACLDLTSLGDADDEELVEALCARAMRPVPDVPDLRVAAVCVWPRLVPVARRELARSGVRIAAATGGFPDPSADLTTRLGEVARAIDAGADEVDVVVNRRLLGDPPTLAEELAAVRATAAGVTWKAILETGALTTEDTEAIARLCIEAGADFLKTSTGKGPPGATPAAARTLVAVIGQADRPVGLKVSGGVRTAHDAIAYLGVVRDELGPRWLDPGRFRIGASSLLDDLATSG